jgi:hypothetical protein
VTSLWDLVADEFDPPPTPPPEVPGWEPQPKQAVAQSLATQAFELLYGGAAGGGKSYFLSNYAVLYALCHDGAHIGIVRKTLRRLKETHGLTLPAIIGGLAKHNASENTWTFPNGSIIRFIQLHETNAEQAYKSVQFDLLLFDEVTELPELQYTFMLSRVRSTRGHRTGVIVTANPEGPGFRWVRRRWVRPKTDDLADGQAPPKPLEVWRPPLPGQPGRWARPRAFVPATIYDNPKLIEQDPDYVTSLESITDPRLRAALLEGDWDAMDQIPGALWSQASIDKHRVDAALVPVLRRTVTAVDPAAGHADDSDDTGILTVGSSRELHGYVLADDTCHLDPAGWGRTAVIAAWRHGSQCIVGEKNQGGEMVRFTIKTAMEALLADEDALADLRAEGITPKRIPVKLVHAAKGKKARAEPVAVAEAAGRIHHVGVFEELEEEQTTWIPELSPQSPNRVDALVWAATFLRLVGTAETEAVSTPSPAERTSPEDRIRARARAGRQALPWS